MKLFDKVGDFIIKYDDLLKLLLIIFLFMFFCITIIKTYDNKTIDKISKLSEIENVVIYTQCFKLEGKYYCIDLD